MPVNIEKGKSEIELERYALRKDEFFNQTPAENRERLNGITDVIKELKMIETIILVEGIGK